MERSIICIGRGGIGRAFERKGIVCLGKDKIDITNLSSISSVLNSIRPKYIINCAGIVGIDKCKNDIHGAYTVNVGGSINLASYCYNNKCKLIQLSTVYSNNNTIYSRTKYMSSSAVINISNDNLVIKLPWVFGRDIDNYIKDAINNKEVNIYSDETCFLAYDNDIVDFVFSNLDKSGYISIANKGLLDRKRIMDFIGTKYKLISRVNPINSELSITNYMRPWSEALTEFINELRSV